MSSARLTSKYQPARFLSTSWPCDKRYDGYNSNFLECLTKLQMERCNLEGGTVLYTSFEAHAYVQNILDNELTIARQSS
jgi:hypothetical protein